MVKKYYLLSLVAILLIPATTVLGGMLFGFINPEIAAGHPNYERNFRLLALARSAAIWLTLLVPMGLGLLCCFFLVKSRKQPYAWMALAVLGPFGIMILTTLRDREPLPGDTYQQLAGKLKLYLRIPLELCLFALVWIVADQMLSLYTDLSILHESRTTGYTVAEIIDIRNASGGMWAFGDGLRFLYLMVLFYLLWPICFNAICRLPGLRASIKRA